MINWRQERFTIQRSGFYEGFADIASLSEAKQYQIFQCVHARSILYHVQAVIFKKTKWLPISVQMAAHNFVPAAGATDSDK